MGLGGDLRHWAQVQFMTKVRAHPGSREQGEAALGPSQGRLSPGGWVRQSGWEATGLPLGSWTGAEALVKVMPRLSGLPSGVSYKER